MLKRIRDAVDYITGASTDPPAALPLPLGSVLWGVWWGVLIIIIWVFSGQSSKFIYIDF